IAKVKTQTVQPGPNGTFLQDLTAQTTYYYTDDGLSSGTDVFDGKAVRSTRVTYDERERMYPERVWNALGQEKGAMFYPAFDAVAWERDVNGLVVNKTFDGFGRVRSITGPALVDTDLSYGPGAGYPLTVTMTGADGSGSRMTYDRLGREAIKEVK